MSKVVPFKPRLYDAKRFTARTGCGDFAASGTFCGNIDFVGPFDDRTYPLSPDEVLALINMLKQARQDVLDQSDPLHDPRIVDRT